MARTAGDHDSRAARSFTTEELSTATWSDFERLFSQGGGWDFCGCMLFQRGYHLSGKEFRKRSAAHARNLEEKRELVCNGRAHGILVYSDREPVGWCQYGPVDELPFPGGGRLDTGVRRRLQLDEPGRVGGLEPQWRITCFVTHKDYRRRGIAGIALGAALEAIEDKGGGWVEATPIVGSHYDGRYHQIVNTYGRDSRELRAFLETWPKRSVRRIGPVPAARGSFGGRSGSGTVSMFEEHGFEAMKIVGDVHVSMMRHVHA